MKCLRHLFFCLLILMPAISANGAERMSIANKINIGQKLALYPSVVTVIGANVDGRVNWLMVTHTGIVNHQNVLVSIKEDHYTTKGILEEMKFSLNLVKRDMLRKADYVGTVSGATVDKSKVFNYQMGENGTPVITDSPLAMELNVIDIYKSGGFNNYICSIANTYAAPEVLDKADRLDYNKLKPVLFEFPTYSYLATGELLGKCRQLDKLPGMSAKESMSPDGITRLSRIEVLPEYLLEYKKYATEVGEISLRTEPGVLTMYALAEQDNPCIITILETYSSREAYKKHIESEHFQKYKQGTLKMVKSLQLLDQTPLNPANQITNYMVNGN